MRALFSSDPSSLSWCHLVFATKPFVPGIPDTGTEPTAELLYSWSAGTPDVSFLGSLMVWSSAVETFLLVSLWVGLTSPPLLGPSSYFRLSPVPVQILSRGAQGHGSHPYL
jgi:hypothetical protein